LLGLLGLVDLVNLQYNWFMRTLGQGRLSRYGPEAQCLPGPVIRMTARPRVFAAAGALAGALLAGATAASVTGRMRFERRIANEIDELFTRVSDPSPGVLTEADIQGLPEPVQRWLRYSDVVGKPRPAIVRLKQEGRFRQREDGPFLPLEAEQYFTVDPPAFLWQARLRMAPLVSVAGRDRYAGGRGDIDMRLLWLIPVARKRGGGLNQGDLQRFLTEAIWFPAGAVSRYIRWQPVDTDTARATMSYGGESGSADFTFDQRGRLTRMTTNRYNDARGRLERWKITINGYAEFTGVRVATEGDATWNYESGDFTYFRWRITELEFNRPDRY
jgi:hypothetical protein